MLKLDDYIFFEKLYSDSHTEVYRGERLSNHKKIILKTTKENHSTDKDIATLQHEFNLLQELHLEGFIQPETLFQQHHQWVSIFEHIPGQLLQLFLDGKPLELETFFRIALQLIDIIDSLHQHRIIHKDIKSNSIIIDSKTLAIKFIDLNATSQILEESQEYIHPKLLEGELTYMSPEQTGRLNRSIDHRSDFYSLGILFFEMLTGQLPFQALEPIELIHAQLTKIPPLASSLNPLVPEMISAIIAKLLAKMPEERYDSAVGLKADLVECQKQWTEYRRIESFELGRQDIHDHLHISQKLYGRKTESNALYAAFDRVSQGSTELFLISGHAGIGKTSLAHEIYKPITGQHGYFAGGKFDQLQHNQPYSAFISVFHALIRQVLAEPEEALTHLRNELNQRLGNILQIILDVIPEMEVIIGPQSKVPELPPTQAQNRFHLAFQKLISAFASSDHPLIIFLDNLQWADVASLNLLKAMLMDSELRHTLFIGSYRDNEVDPNHPLLTTLNAVQNAQVIVEQIKLNPLSDVDIQHLVSDTLSRPEEEVQPLANFIAGKTQGNPFFIDELLRALYQKQLITFSYEKNYWQWNLDNIREQLISNHAVDLLIIKIQKLPPELQALLSLAACIGHTFNLGTLATVTEQPVHQTAKELWEIIQANLIKPLGDDYKTAAYDIVKNPDATTYQFTHDCMQQAAYQLITIENRQQVHLKIGRLLLKHSTEDFSKNERILFQILEHFNLGLALITDTDEQHQLAKLNLLATQKAKASVAYQAAEFYVDAAIVLLGSVSWQTHRSLLFALTKEKAECAYLLSQYEEAEAQFEKILQYATSDLEKAEIYIIKMLLYTDKNQYEQCIQTGVLALTLFGVHLPLHPRRYHIFKEIIAITIHTFFNSITHIKKTLKETTDPEQIIVNRLLFEMGTATYFANPNLFALTICKGVTISLRDGYTNYNIPMLSGYATFMLQFNQWRTAFEITDLTDVLIQKVENPIIIGRYRATATMFFNHWRYPLDYCADYAQKSHQILLEAGDLNFAAYSKCMEIAAWHVREMPLKDLHKKNDTVLQALKHLQDQGWYNVFSFHEKNYILHLQNMVDQDIETLLGLTDLNKTPLMKWCYYAMFNELLFLQGDYQKALQMAEAADHLKRSDQGFVWKQDLYFFYALTLAQCMTNAPRSLKLHYWRVFRRIEKLIKTWVKICPINIKHKYLLILAEKARLLGDFRTAIAHYDKAIVAAQEQNFIRTEAIANELAGEFYLAQKKPKFAKWYLRDAQYAYQRWGALTKAKQLMQRYPEWLQAQPASASSKTIILGDTITTTTNTQSLDFLSILKVSQAISSEIHIDKLLQQLLAILMENGGAERGVIVVNHGRRWFVEAEMHANNPEVSMPNVPLEGYEKLPTALLMYVQRTKKSYISIETEQPIHLMDDPYVARVQPKSMLCVPIIQQGQVKTIIYLENSLTANAFTLQNLEMLQLLSAQIAISLENAYLYAASNRFSPEEFLQQLGRFSLTDVQLGDQVQKKLSVMFCDMRSFTALSEKMTPAQNFAFINTFLGYMEPIIRHHQGFIDKYIGDAIMALYGETADSAVDAGIDMVKGLEEFNQKCIRSNLPEVEIGIGINTGELMLGIIGTLHRTESSVIGDTVNTASRIEKLTKEYGIPLVIGGDTIASLQNPSKYMMRLIDEVTLRGKSTPTEIWEIYNTDEEAIRQVKYETREMFDEARQLYKEGKYKKAYVQFMDILQKNPQDKVVQYYKDLCEGHL